MPCVEEGPQGLPGDQTGGSQRDGCSVPVTYGHRRMASGQRIKPTPYKKWARKVGLSVPGCREEAEAADVGGDASLSRIFWVR